MRIWIDKDKRYPNYTFTTDPDRWDVAKLESAKISDELPQRMKAAFAEYDAVQDILWELHRNEECHD